METSPLALPPPQPCFHEADLTKGMEHLRPYVSVPTAHNLPPKQQAPPNKKASDTCRTTLSKQPNPGGTTYGVPSDLIKPHRHPPQRPQSPSRNPEKRRDPTQFGSRYLEEGDDVFEFNAWDNVEVDEGFKAFAEEMYKQQRAAPVSGFDRGLHCPGRTTAKSPLR